jgi:general stress protein 26
MAIIKHQSDSGEPEIWMATGGRSPKIEEINKKSNVNVSLQSAPAKASRTLS